MVFFVVDSVVMLVLDYYLDGDIMESLLDYVIHAWVIYSFIKGVSAYKKLKNLPEEDLSAFEPTPTETVE